MPVEIYRCGLNTYPRNEYLEKMKKDAEENRISILVVPDWVSFDAEKSVCKYVGGTGLNGVEVLSFHQMIRYFSNDDEKLLKIIGKQLLLKKICDKLIDENSVYFDAKDKGGFLDEMLNLVDEWRNNDISIDSLNIQYKKIPDSLLKMKFETIIQIYEQYSKEFDESDYTDETEQLKNVAKRIENNDRLKNCKVYFDEFTDFLPVHLMILGAFLKCDATVELYFRAKDEPMTHGLFTVPEKGIKQIKKLCYDFGFSYSEKIYNKSLKKSSQMSFICENYDSFFQKYNGLSDNINLYRANGIYEEVERTAAAICDLVIEEGYSFCDIGIMCGNFENYLFYIESIFSTYKIPYYADYKIPLSNHPIAVLILSAFSAVSGMTFSYNSIFKYLKTGLVLDDKKDIDFLELYVKKYKIIGSMWKNEKYFTEKNTGIFDTVIKNSSGKKNNNAKKLNDLRTLVTDPLFKLYENTKGKKRGIELATSFFQFLQDINLFNKINDKIEDFREKGFENDASQFQYVWNTVVNMLEQVVMTVGEDLISRDEFFEYIKAGIEGAEISTIPAVSNGVSVGDATLRNPDTVKALFIIGATSDEVPRNVKFSGILSDDERESLSDLDIDSGSSLQNDNYEFKLLLAINDCIDRLFVSYSTSDASGNIFHPSSLFDTFMRMFNNKSILSDMRLDDNRLYISTPDITFHKLLIKMSENEKMPPLWMCIKNWFMEHEEYKNEFEVLSLAECYSERKAEISEAMAKKLYENYKEYSISTLEQYFKCPFEYFISNGLKIREDEVYEISSTDTGSLLHFAISEFCKKVDDNAQTLSEKKEKWDKLTEDKSNNIIEDIMTEIKNGNDYSIVGQNRISIIFDRMEKNLKSVVKTVALSIKNSKYTLSKSEFSFDGFKLSKGGHDVFFRGIIDRIDVFDNKIRIIDYKSSKKDLNLEKVINGVDIQMLLYALAAKEISEDNKDRIITGMFYNRINNFVQESRSAEEAINNNKKNNKLSGLIIEDENISNGVEMDCDLEIKGESTYLPLELIKTKDRYNKSRSSFIDRQGIEKIIEIVVENCVNADKKIKTGDISVYPLKAKGVDACMYCPYSTICIYDREKDECINKGKSLSEYKDEEDGNNE